MDIFSVIYLGHMLKQPLIRSSSELGDRLEPHDWFMDVRAAAGCMTAVRGRGGGVPGVGSRVGTRRVLYRVPSLAQD